MLRQAARRFLPPAVKSRLKKALFRIRGLSNFYESAYERLARTEPPEVSIGLGNFDLIGKIELGILLAEGLKPSDVVVDLGCGTDRLAVHLIPRLTAGRYVGIDISKTMLRQAKLRTAGLGGSVEWKHQVTTQFDLPDASADTMCAFSVFTHMEAEDTWRYLVAILRVVRPGGKLILSCLPLSLPGSRQVFLDQARLDLQERWAGVRNVVTTEETIEILAGMAGWKVVRWLRGDEPTVPVPGMQEPQALGQSTCVLERPS